MYLCYVKALYRRTDVFGSPGISTPKQIHATSNSAKAHITLPMSLSIHPPDFPRMGSLNFFPQGQSKLTPAGFIISSTRWIMQPAVTAGANGRNSAANSNECEKPLCLSSIGMIGTCRPMRLLDLSMSGRTEPMMIPAARASSEPSCTLSVVQTAAARTPDAK